MRDVGRSGNEYGTGVRKADLKPLPSDLPDMHQQTRLFQTSILTIQTSIHGQEETH